MMVAIARGKAARSEGIRTDNRRPRWLENVRIAGNRLVRTEQPLPIGDVAVDASSLTAACCDVVNGAFKLDTDRS